MPKGEAKTIELTGVPVARSFRSRIAGLIGRSAREELFLLLPRCSSVHTWFMRAAIDIVFLDANRAIVAIAANAAPWRTFIGPGDADAVLELPAGHAAELGMSTGDLLRLHE